MACRLDGNITLLLNADQGVLSRLLDPLPDGQLLVYFLFQLFIHNADLLGVVVHLVLDLEHVLVLGAEFAPDDNLLVDYARDVRDLVLELAQLVCRSWTTLNVESRCID